MEYIEGTVIQSLLSIGRFIDIQYENASQYLNLKEGRTLRKLSFVPIFYVYILQFLFTFLLVCFFFICKDYYFSYLRLILLEFLIPSTGIVLD